MPPYGQGSDTVLGPAGSLLDHISQSLALLNGVTLLLSKLRCFCQ